MYFCSLKLLSEFLLCKNSQRQMEKKLKVLESLEKSPLPKSMIFFYLNVPLTSFVCSNSFELFEKDLFRKSQEKPTDETVSFKGLLKVFT